MILISSKSEKSSWRLNFQLLLLVYSLVLSALLSNAFTITDMIKNRRTFFYENVRRHDRRGQNNQHEEVLLSRSLLRLSSSSPSPSSFAQLFDEPTANWNDEVIAEADRAFRRGMQVRWIWIRRK